MATGKFGFVPVRGISSSDAPLHTFRVRAGGNNQFAKGDPVCIDPSNSTGRVIPVTAATPIGIIAGIICDVKQVATTDGNKPKPLTFNQPSKGPYLVSSQEGYAMVCIDPNQTYICQIDVSASIGLIGKTVNVSGAASVPNNSSGISTYTLAGASVTASAVGQFKIVNLAPNELVAGYGVDIPSGTGVEVKINRPLFGSSTNHGV